MNAISPPSLRPLPASAISDDMTHVRSIPLPFPQPDLRWQGELPVAVYEYRNADATLACLSARYQTDAGKILRPATVWRNGAGQMSWVCKGLPEDRL